MQQNSYGSFLLFFLTACLTLLLQYGRCLSKNSAKLLGFSCMQLERAQNVVPNSDGVLRFTESGETTL